MGGVRARPLPDAAGTRVCVLGDRATASHPMTNAATTTARRPDTVHLHGNRRVGDDDGAHAAKQARRRWATGWTAGASIRIMCRAQSCVDGMGGVAGLDVHGGDRMPRFGV